MRCTAATSTCTATGYWEPTALPKERSWACCCAQGKDWSDQGCRAGHGSFLQREDGYGRGDEASVAVRAGHPWRLACLAFARPEVNAYGGGPTLYERMTQLYKLHKSRSIVGLAWGGGLSRRTRSHALFF